MKRGIVSFAGRVAGIVGRERLYRVGRWMYMLARHESANGIDSNGEQWVQQCVLRACAGKGEDIVVFDIGANLGDWLDALLDSAERTNTLDQIRPHVFEPVPSTFERLKQRGESDSRNRRTLYRSVAMSSAEGTARMYVVRDGAGTNSLHADHGAAQQAGHSVDVPTGTLDSYLETNSIPLVQLVKIDTEGHDMEVLRGARAALAAERLRVVQFEYNHRWIYSRNFLRDVLELVRGLPYTVGKVTLGTVEFYDEWHPELERFFEGNYLLVHDSARAWFSSVSIRFDASNTMQQA